jgi:ABC-type spermidine/putrescine transport system permease subunit II
MVKFGVTPEINAISVLMLVVSSVLLLASYKLQTGDRRRVDEPERLEE